MITTIIFDLSDVYINGVVGVDKYIQKNISQKISMKNIFITEIDQLFRGEISENLFWQAVIDKNKWNMQISDLENAIRMNFKEIKGTKKIIVKLRKKGYTLGLLSIHAREWVDYCNNIFGHHSLFDHISYSFESGIFKPKKKAYTELLKKLNVDPQECIFIDDKLENVEGAMKLGMLGIEFKNAIQLERDLKNRGIAI